MPALSRCSFSGCERTAMTDFVGCLTCWDAYCPGHQHRDYHLCLLLDYKADEMSIMRDLQEHGRHLNKMASAIPSVKHAATKLRPSIAFTLDIPEGLPAVRDSKTYTRNRSWLKGGVNLHVPLTYEDGVKMVALFRQHFGNTNVRTEESIPNEVATMQALREVAPSFIPAVYKPLGNYAVEFFFMDFMEGSSLKECKWKLGAHRHAPAIVQDLATFFIQLSQKQFSKIGSLHPTANGTDSEVGHFVNFYHHTETIPIRGPFATSRECWLSHIDVTLTAAEQGLVQRTDPTFLIEWYLARLELQELVDQDAEMAMSGPTYITHREMKVDQLLVKHGRIAAILDWEGAYTAPFAEAFATPFGFVPLKELYGGSNDLGHCERMLIDEFVARGRPDLAQAIKGSRKYHRLHHHRSGLNGILGARDAFLGDMAPSRPRSMSEWVAEALVKFDGHPGLGRVQKVAAARRAKCEELGVRKTTVVDIDMAALGFGK